MTIFGQRMDDTDTYGYDDGPETIDIPAEAAALIFHENGSLSLAIPKEISEPGMAEMLTPRTILAATELLFRLQAGELSIEELAAAFEARSKS